MSVNSWLPFGLRYANSSSPCSVCHSHYYRIVSYRIRRNWLNRREGKKALTTISKRSNYLSKYDITIILHEHMFSNYQASWRNNKLWWADNRVTHTRFQLRFSFTCNGFGWKFWGNTERNQEIESVRDPYQNEKTNLNHLDFFLMLSTIIYTYVSFNWTQHCHAFFCGYLLFTRSE